jgi:tRNA(fMet)-specific endonuclease VapC
MPLYLLDTDTLTRFRLGDAAIVQRLLATPPEQLTVSVISVEEQLTGWYSQLRHQPSDERLAEIYARIVRTVELLGQFRLLTFDVTAIVRYRELQKLRLNVGKMDLRIASIALTTGATVVTSNGRDFARIPGLVWEDWAKESAP